MPLEQCSGTGAGAARSRTSAGAGAKKLCYFRLRLRLRLQKIPYKWIFCNNLPKKQLEFPLSNNYSVQLAATILPSNQKKNEKENF